MITCCLSPCMEKATKLHFCRIASARKSAPGFDSTNTTAGGLKNAPWLQKLKLWTFTWVLKKFEQLFFLLFLFNPKNHLCNRLRSSSGLWKLEKNVNFLPLTLTAIYTGFWSNSWLKCSISVGIVAENIKVWCVLKWAIIVWTWWRNPICSIVSTSSRISSEVYCNKVLSCFSRISFKRPGVATIICTPFFSL